MAQTPERIARGKYLFADRDTGIGSWTDGEKIRAIRGGVDKDGNALFPMMPYSGYRPMSDGDVQALVAYLDTLPPVANPLPKSKLAFPVSRMIKFAPQRIGIDCAEILGRHPGKGQPGHQREGLWPGQRRRAMIGVVFDSLKPVRHSVETHPGAS